MKLFSAIKATSQVVNVPNASRTRKDEGVLALIVTPNEGTLRINPDLATALGVSTQEVIESTNKSHGVFVNLISFEVGNEIRQYFGIVDGSETAGFKLASPTKTTSSALQFSSQAIWDAKGGKKDATKTYALSFDKSIVAVREDGSFVSWSDALNEGAIAETRELDGSLTKATWAENQYGAEVGTRVEVMFLVEETMATTTAAAERKKGVRKPKKEAGAVEISSAEDAADALANDLDDDATSEDEGADEGADDFDM